MPRCCVIGGNGFIGRRLVKNLASTRSEVLVIDRVMAPQVHDEGIVTYIQGDYSETDCLESALSGIDEIVLLAHSTTPKTSFEDSMEDLLANVPSSVKFFEAVSSLRLRKIVFVSSGGTIYGRARKLPITEDHPTLPISPYGITKLTIEKYGYMYHVLKDLPIVCVRPGNAFGEGQRPFSGQGFIATAYGSDTPCGRRSVYSVSGGRIRDYLYIDDLVEGIISALDGGVVGESYNLGTGIGRDNVDVTNDISTIVRNSGFDVKVNILPERPFDVPVNILDSTKLYNQTGWKPHTLFENGLRGMWEWFIQKRGMTL